MHAVFNKGVIDLPNIREACKRAHALFRLFMHQGLSMFVTLVFPKHTLFSILKTRAARALREKSTIIFVLSLRTKRESQSGFVENRYNTLSVLRCTINLAVSI